MSDTWLDNYYVDDIYGEDERKEDMTNKELQAKVTELENHIKVTEWARDKAQQEVKELKDKNKKLRTAITYMLHQLTNKDNPPSIKIAMAIEESIPVYAMLKDG